MQANNQQVLFYPVDETFRSSSFSVPMLLISVPIVAIGAMIATVGGIVALIIVGVERITGDKKYTKKIVSFLRSI